jgi:medium-chain acyl-[acyl-carrier-protein] hydrolase
MTTTQTFDSWVKYLRSNFDAKLRLFCFPSAGGEALSFSSWSADIKPDVQVYPIELPGRGLRQSENPFTHIEPLIEALTRALLPYFDKPFAFFGHGMGGLISFELAHLLRQDYGQSPVNLFISGHRAPQIPLLEPPIHNLPEPKFLNKLRRFNGTLEIVLKNAELTKLLLPTLRADFAILETYVYTPRPRLDFPITALGGLQDSRVSCNDLEAWREQTNVNFSMQMFKGNHSFIRSAQPLLLQFLNQELGFYTAEEKKIG